MRHRMNCIMFRAFLVASLYATLNLKSIYSYSPSQCCRRVKVYHYYPVKGSELGGTRLTILGTGFLRVPFQSKNDSIYCIFDKQIIQATPVSDQQLHCYTPPHRPGFVSFRVVSAESMSDEYSIDRSLVKYEFTVMASLFSVTPNVGTGGTQVQVLGGGFQNSTNLTCFFGSVASRAMFISHIEIACTVPNLTPSSVGEITHLTVSNNEVDLEGDWAKLQFMFINRTKVHLVDPTTAPCTGGTNIFVRGVGLSQTRGFLRNLAFCRIGDQVVAALILSDNELVCTLPVMHNITSVTFYALTVSIDGGHKYTDSISAPIILIHPPSEIFSAIATRDKQSNVSLVRVYGSHFYRSSHISCVVGVSIVRATWKSNALVFCDIPTSALMLETSLQICTNGQTNGMSKNSVLVQLTDSAILSNIDPIVGPQFGGISVSLTGFGFNKNSFYCRFGDVMVRTFTVFNHTSAICILPPAPKDTCGSVSIEISTTHGLYFTHSGRQFTYICTLFIESVDPTIGPLRGGTALLLRGLFRAPPHTIECRFETSHGHKNFTPLIQQTDDMIMCMTPAYPHQLTESFAFVSIDLVISNYSDWSISSSFVSFYYYRELEFKSLYPFAGSEFGGTDVILRGRFPRTPTALCMFGSAVAVEATISAQSLTCRTPSAPSTFLRDPTVPITVSLNGGRDTELTNLSFRYLKASYITRIVPTYGSVLGGAPVRLYGSGFPSDMSRVLCFFGTVMQTEGRILSDEEIECDVPYSKSLGIFQVTVSFNFGVESIPSYANFTFITHPRITSISPMIIPNVGGITVTLSGEGFNTLLHSGALYVTLDHILVEATFISDHLVTFFSPKIDSAANMTLQLLSDNGNFAQGLLTLSLIPQPVLLSVTPSLTFAAAGKTKLILYGAHFSPSLDFDCTFESGTFEFKSRAQSISNEEALCLKPTLEVGTYRLALRTLGVYSNHLLFTVYDSFSVHSIRPVIGSISGGTNVTVLGSNFSELLTLSCLFGSLATVPAHFYSSDTITCVSPKGIVGTVKFAVAVDGLILHDQEEISYTYLRQPYISHIIPNSAPLSGGSKLSIVGGFFNTTLDMHLDLEGFRTKLNVLNETFGYIILPNISLSQKGTSSVDNSRVVSISMNNADFYPGPQLVFYDDIIVNGFSPTFGFDQGGEIISVVGFGFFRSPDARCRFGTQITKAIIRSRTNLECRSPRSFFIGPVSFAVSLNSFDWTSGAIFYSYIPKPVIMKVTPTMLPVMTRTIVSIFWNFPANFSFSISCLFGNISVDASIVNHNLVLCASPETEIPGSQPLDIVVNGVAVVGDNDTRPIIDFVGPIIYTTQPSFGSLSRITAISISRIPSFTPVHYLSSSTIDRSLLLCRFTFDNAVQEFTRIIHNNSSHSTCDTPDMSANFKQDVVHSKLDLGYHSLDEFITMSQLSHAFIFKRSPIEIVLKPSFGSPSGNTEVHVYPTESAHGFWLNSEMISCRFGHFLTTAVWIGFRELLCLSPASGTQPMDVEVSVTDDGIDFSGKAIFRYTELPSVVSFRPNTAYTDSHPSIIVNGFGFSSMRSEASLCMFRNEVIVDTIITPAIIENSTVLTCSVTADMMKRPGYWNLFVSNNGQEFSESITATFSVIALPTIAKIFPTSGIVGKIIDLTVEGSNLSGAPIFCNLQLHAELLQSAGSLAHVFNSSSGSCSIQCPIEENTVPYIVYFSSLDHIVYSTQFRCEPGIQIESILPTIIIVGRIVPLQIIGTGIDLRQTFQCAFESPSFFYTTEATAMIDSSVQCDSPRFLFPQKIRVGLIISSQRWDVSVSVEVNVVPELILEASIPSKIFPGEPFIVKGHNFRSYHIIGLNCAVAGVIILNARFHNDTCIECITTHHTPTVVAASLTIEVRDSFSFSNPSIRIDIIAYPVVHGFAPNLGLCQKITTISLIGQNLDSLITPLCYFDHMSTTALRVSDGVLKCDTPLSSWKGAVKFRLIASNLFDPVVDDAFTYIEPWAVASIAPRSGPMEGGTPLTIHGRSFIQSRDIFCLFGETKARAVIHSEFVLTCESPATTLPGLVSFYLSIEGHPSNIISFFNGDIGSHDTGFFLYYSNPFLISAKLFDVKDIVHRLNLEVVLSQVIAENELIYMSPECIFTKSNAHARVIGDSKLVCDVSESESHNLKQMSVTITMNGIDITNYLTVEYTYNWTVDFILPDRGPLSGGTKVTLFGLGISDPLSSLQCRFGGQIPITAHFIPTIKQYVCITPSALGEGSVRLFLSIDGKEWHNSGATFLYENWLPTGIEIYPFHWNGGMELPKSTLVVEQICPAVGPSAGKTTEIRVYGPYFPDEGTTLCWFGHIATIGRFLSSSSLSCELPPSTMNKGVAFYTTSFTLIHYFLDGRQLKTMEPLQFMYYNPQIVSSSLKVHPIVVLSSTATFVTISSAIVTSMLRAHDAMNTTMSVLIRYGSVVIPAIYHSDVIEFVTVPLNDSGKKSEQSIYVHSYEIALSLSLDGGGSYLDCDYLTVFDDPSLHDIDPGILIPGLHSSISIFGSSVALFGPVQCNIGVYSVVANVLNSSLIKCELGTNISFAIDVTFVPVSVSWIDFNFTSPSLRLTVVRKPYFTSIRPFHVLEDGGEVVVITGNHLTLLGSRGKIVLKPYGSIGDDISIDLFLYSDEAGTFTTPALIVGQYSPCIYIDGSLEDSGLVLSVLPRFTITRISPDYGNPVEGGVRTVSGYFDKYTDYECRLSTDWPHTDHFFTPAVITNSSMLECNLPSAVSIFGSSVEAQIYLSIKRKIDGFQSNAIAYTFAYSHYIFSIHPRFISPADSIRVKGHGFLNFKTYQCKLGFSDGNVRFYSATYIDSGEVRCGPFDDATIGVTQVSVVSYGRFSEGNVLKIHTRSKIRADEDDKLKKRTSELTTSESHRNISLAATDLFPSRLPAMSDTKLFITGHNFNTVSEDLLMCIVGSNKFPVTIVSPELLSCALSPLTIGIFRVSLSVRGSFHLEISMMLTIHPPVVVDNYAPLQGPTDGGTRIFIIGRAFAEVQNEIICLFSGGASASARVYNDSMVSCDSPPFFGEVNSTVSYFRIASAHEDWTGPITTFDLPFHYYEAEVISSIIPKIGPVEGNTSLTVEGSGFLDSVALCCKFGSYIQRATYVSHKKIICSTPPLSDLTVRVRKVFITVSNNGMDFSRSSSSFSYYDTPAVHSMHPQRGPPGTEIIIEFNQQISLKENSSCLFNHLHVRDSIPSPSKMMSCQVPHVTSEIATLQLATSFNGVNYHHTGLIFHYTLDPQIYGVNPVIGPRTGGNLVWVDGANFDLSLFCDFGGTLSEASISSDKLLSCIAPRMETGIVIFNLRSKWTINETDSSRNVFKYTFLDNISILYLNTYHGSVLGGTELLLYCLGLPYNISLTCIFGPEDIISDATLHSSGALSCITPKVSEAGLVGVRVGYASRHALVILSTNEVSFTYTVPIKMLHISPERGPSTGLTNVTIDFTGNVVTSIRYAVLCRFCNLTFSGAFLSTNAVTCPLPYLTDFGNMNVDKKLLHTILFLWDHDTPMQSWHQVIFNVRSGNEEIEMLDANMTADELQRSFRKFDGFDTAIAEITRTSAMFQISFTTTKVRPHTKRLHIVMNKQVHENLSTRTFLETYHTCSISVSFNGVDFFGEHQYTFDDRPYILGLYPSHGPLRGGTPVVVKGYGFTPPNQSKDISCLFGGIQVTGMFISKSEILCTTPSFPTCARVHVGIVGLNVKYSSMSDVLFDFVEDIKLYHSFPRTVPMKMGYFGEFVTIFGENMIKTENLMCHSRVDIPGTAALKQFSQYSKAIYLNSTSIRCPNVFSWNRLSINPSIEENGDEREHLPTYVDLILFIKVTTNGEDWSNAINIPFIPPEHIDSIHPDSGRETGGTLINIIGQNFVKSDELRCRFGEEVAVPATFISSTYIQCKSPPVNEIGKAYTHNLTITNNGVHHSNGIPFEYSGDLVILDFHPKMGWMSGGVEVSVSFYSYTTQRKDRMPTYCKFNNTISYVIDVNVTQGLLRCRTPPSPVTGYALLEITQNQVDFFSSIHSFLYIADDLRSVKMAPNHGPSRGGTSVQVKGIQMLTGLTWAMVRKSAKCRFGFIVVEARIMRDIDTIICRSPPKPADTKSVEVGVSLSGLQDDFVNIGFFCYDQDITIFDMKPNNGPIHGGTTVNFYGGPFIQYNEHDLSCRFGDLVVQGAFVDESLIRCVSPRFQVLESIETVSIFNMLWIPEIQSIYVAQDDAVGEIQIIETVGAEEVKNEVQMLVFESHEYCERVGSYRLKLREVWTDPIPPYAVATVLQEILQRITGLNAVQVQQSHSSYVIEFYSYVGSPPHGYIPGTAGNLPLIVTDASNLRGNCTLSVIEIQNGTDPLSNDDRGRGFRLVSPGGSLDYPLLLQTRWLQYNETESTMKEALVNAGGVPSDIMVVREGPFKNGGYRWDVFFPKGFSFHGAKFEVVRNGGGGIKLQGSNVGVETRIGRLGVVPSSGHFMLSFDRGKFFNPETTKPLSFNSSVQALKSALEELGSIHEVQVSYHKSNTNTTHSGADRWDITFLSLRDSGDLPLLSYHHIHSRRTSDQSSPNIHINERRKGISNTVHRLNLSTCDYYRLVCDDHVGDYLHIDASASDVETELMRLSSVRYVTVEIYRHPNATELLILRISESLCSSVFGAYLFNKCNRTVNSLCFSHYTRAAIWTEKTITDVHGNFSLFLDSNSSHSTPDIGVGAPVTAVENALSSIFRNFTVETSCDLKHSTSGFFLENKLLIKIRDFGRDYYATNDQPILRVDESRLHGTPYPGSFLAHPIRTNVSVVTRDCPFKGLTVPVDVTINGLDFSSSESFFHYRPPLEILGLIPPNGPVHGGTVISVNGFGFDDTQLLLCRLRSAYFLKPSQTELHYGYGGEDDFLYSNARYVNNTVFQCQAPPSMYPGTFYLSLVNPIDFFDVSTELPFIYDQPIVISEMSPVYGPSSGNSSVSIFGGPFRSTGPYLKCRFGDTIVQAYFINEHCIYCITPVHSPGRVQVELTQNGVDYIQCSRSFSFHETPHFRYIQPQSGPVSSDVEVHIYGLGFYDTQSAICKIGSFLHTTLVYINENELICNIPALPPQEQLHWLQLSRDHNSNYYVQTSYIEPLQYPTYRSLYVSLEVSLNGQEYISTGFKYIYQADVIISGISTMFGPVIGGTPVFLLGSGFVNSTYLTCQFGAMPTSRAVFLTRNVVLCVSPAFLSDWALLDQSSVTLGVSNNHESFLFASEKFSYFSQTSSGSYQPSFEKETELLCPKGAYCKMKYTSNFTECPLGTYQPDYGKDSCKRCPVGSICPVIGSPATRRCPEGYICDLSGLGHAETPCPGGFTCGKGTGQRAINLMDQSIPEFEMCWDNSTDDFGLQVSNVPGRLWDERRLLPLDSVTERVIRGQFCSRETDQMNEYKSQRWQYEENGIARPIPCRQGFYCPPGTSTNATDISHFTSQRLCFGTAFCPTFSFNPLGDGYCPRGFYCRFGHRIPCPVGSECPFDGLWDPIPCSPGTFNYMIGQVRCTDCPIGHFCDGYGRLDPAICPHGMICSENKLMRPNLRCPAGFYCLNGTQTSDPFRNDTTLRPYPCSPGTYCTSGTGYNTVDEGNFLYAQPCSAGFYCEAASVSATGSGPCPPGFVCPKGTGTPIPSSRGFHARYHGSIQATACLPGFFAPLIESQECYPCPLGMSCDGEGLISPDICPPGTFRDSDESTGVSCTPCPQGSWSQKWQATDRDQCVPCPSGVVCNVEGTVYPCNVHDLPTPFEPIILVDGVPFLSYDLPSVDRPLPLSIDECLLLNFGKDEEEFFFGELIPPYIDILGRGPHLRRTDQSSVKYQSFAKCYRNSKPQGTLLYQHMTAFYGPLPFDQLNKLTLMREGSSNCSQGFHLLNSSLTKPDHKIVYTDPEYDYEGGDDVIRCPLYDEKLGCFVDPLFSGNCCQVNAWTERAIYLASDQFYKGSCLSDQICSDDAPVSARLCPEGSTCEWGSTDISASKCTEGYVCHVGSTRDTSLTINWGQYARLCPEGYFCGGGTARSNAKDQRCSPSFFCPTGVVSAIHGTLANDSLRRNLNSSDIDPFRNQLNMRYIGSDRFIIFSDHDVSCLNSIDATLDRRWKTSLYSEPNMRNIYAQWCARDHKWRHVHDTIRRGQCDCNKQFFTTIILSRLLKCADQSGTKMVAEDHLTEWYMSGANLFEHNQSEDRVVGGKWHCSELIQNIIDGIPLNIYDVLIVENLGSKDNPDIKYRSRISSSEGKILDNISLFREEFVMAFNHRDQINEDLRTAAFNFHRAFELIDIHGDNIEQLVYFKIAGDDVHPTMIADSSDVWRFLVTDVSIKNNSITAGRLDVCECENLLKCPDGTTTVVSTPSSLDSCVPEGTVVRRIPAVSVHRSGDDPFDDLQLSNLLLKATEKATFRFDMSGISNNMTYGVDHRVSIYSNCRPCPTRYNCNVNSVTRQCSVPNLQEQYRYLNQCLKATRVPVCVDSMANNVDVSFCKKNDTILGGSYLLYTVPDLSRCLSLPFFCSNQNIALGRFRRLCQDKLSDGSSGPIYDCSLTSLWTKYVRWKNQICCSGSSLLNYSNTCIQGICNPHDPFIDRIIREKFSDEFQNRYGFSPPTAEPLGHFLMDIDKQEDKQNAEPLSLFSSAFDDGLSEMIALRGCCQCSAQMMPVSMHENTVRSGFPDDKHSEIYLTVTALADVNLSIAVELLNGRYINEFDSYFVNASDHIIHSFIHSATQFSGSGQFEWIYLIEKNTMLENDLDLPYNLPITTLPGGQITFENLVLIDRPSVLLSRSLNRLNSSGRDKQTMYDDDGRQLIDYSSSSSPSDRFPLDVREAASWWDDGDKSVSKGVGYHPFSFLALPYVPFISNCDAFDSHLSISTLLNGHHQCDLIPTNETRPVRQNPSFRQYLPVADRCIGADYRGAKLLCKFEENVEQISENNRWYESGSGKTIFFISRDAVPTEYITAKFNDTTVIEPWGRSKKIGSMVNTSLLVPITVDSVYAGKRNAIPRTITLELKYFQRTEKDKRLVEGKFYFDDLCTTLKPVQYGGNARLFNDMIDQGIEPCALDIQGRIKSFDYNFYVLLYPLDWFQLFNKFQFDVSIYISIYTLAGLLILSMCASLWIFSRLTTKLRYPPSFKVLNPTLQTLQSTIIGCLLAVAPICTSMYLSLSFLKAWTLPFPMKWLKFIGTFINSLPGDWYSERSSYQDIYSRGRVGVSLLAMGLYTLVTGVMAVSFERITKVNRGRLKADIQKRHATKKTHFVWKRANIFLFSIIFQFALLGIWEFSYSSHFRTYALQYILLLKFVELALELVCDRVFECPLQYIPMNVALRITEVLITLGARDFINFIVLIFAQKASAVVIKLYIHPLVKVFDRLWPRWGFLFAERFVRRKTITYEERKEKIEHLHHLNTEIERKSDSVEPILELLEHMSIDWVTAAIAPFMLLLLKIFYLETDIASNYNIRVNEVFYYELFAIYMFPWSITIDVVTLNSLELLKGWRIFEYISYLRFRFNSRKHRWALDSRTFDRGISSKLWGLDLLGFSTQYYFLITFCSSGILLTMIAITILLRAERYNIFSDPSSWLLICLTLVICKMIHIAFSKLSCVKIDYIGWQGLWAIKEYHGVIDDFIASKVTVSTGTDKIDSNQDYFGMLSGTKFREVFLEHNKPWIIQHLKDLIGPKTLNHNEELRDFFRQRFNEILGSGKYSPSARESNNHIISSDDSDDNETFNVRRVDWNGVHVERQGLHLVKQWINRARRRIKFADAVRGIIERGKTKTCFVCRKTSPPCLSLNVFLAKDGIRDSTILDVLINDFVSEYHGHVDDILLWKSYFQAKADLITLCNLCVTGETMESDGRKPRGKVLTRPCDISSDEEDDVRSYETATVLLSSIEGSIIWRWLDTARKNIE